MADRIWNVENKRKQKTVIVVKSKERGARTKVTACGYSPDGRYIAGGTLRCHSTHPLTTILLACLDGALHLWKTNSNFVRPDMTIHAHVKGTETGSLTFSVDGNIILTRGGDHTVKCMFHSRKALQPVAHSILSMGYSFIQAAYRCAVRSSYIIPFYKRDIQPR